MSAVPLLAFEEEEVFRQGPQNWSLKKRLKMQLTFGLVHLVMGIPIAAALSLAIPGWFFQREHLRHYNKTQCIDQSTFHAAAVHAVWNWTILALLLALTISTGV